MGLGERERLADWQVDSSGLWKGRKANGEPINKLDPIPSGVAWAKLASFLNG